MHAADRDCAVLVESLLQSKTDPYIRAAYGATALFIAAVRGRSDITAVLMKAGADPTITGSRGKAAVEIARTKFCEPDDYYKLKIYDSCTGKSKNTADAVRAAHRLLKGYKPLLYVAARNEEPSFIAELLDRGANIDARNHDNATPLHYAAYHNESSAVAALIRRRGGKQ